MDTVNQLLKVIVDLVWGLPMVFILLGAGVILTVYHGFIQFRAFPEAVKLALGIKKESANAPGEVSHFKALCTALSATVGLGNIAGVALAISKGGPGATFWMILVGLLGMATKFNECSLACIFRRTDSAGRVTGGGPMYYIELVPGGKVLAPFYALMLTMAAFGGANMFQANQVASSLNNSFNINPLYVGILLSLVTSFVILGGIRRIASVASFIVPFMGIAYIAGCLSVIYVFADKLPQVFFLILDDAFSGQAIAGGAIGVVIVQGVRRALFSSEAGMGTAAVAHSMAKSDKPVSEGLVALLEPFIDTVVICTLTAVTIIISGAWELSTVEGEKLSDIALTQAAFNGGIPGLGTYFIPIAVTLFAFSTLVSWSLYGEQATKYVFKTEASVWIYKVIFCLCPIAGSVWALAPVLNLSDICFGLMVLPNVWATIWLMPKVRLALNDYFNPSK